VSALRIAEDAMEERTETERKIIRHTADTKFVTPAQKRQRRIALIAVVLVAAITVAGYFLLVPKEKTYTVSSYDTSAVVRGDLPLTAQASGSVTLPVQMNVLSPEEGYAALLYVEEGDSVIKGDLLAVMDVPDLEDELDDLEVELTDAKNSLEKTITSNRIANARAERAIADLKADLADEQEGLAKVEKLVAINASRESELENQQEIVADLQDRIEELELQLEEDILLQNQEVELMRSDISQLETEVRRLRDDIEDASVTSPMDGEVLEVDGSLGVPGSSIVKNQKLFTVADTGSAVIELEVDEEYAGVLEKGDQVALDVGGSDIAGTITGIGRVAVASSDGLGATVPVEVTPNEVTSAVISGATAVGEMELGVLEDIMILPRGPYLTTGSRKYLYVVDGNRAIRTEVTFGDSEGNYIEVINGVQEGDEVITSGYQNFIEFETIKLEQ
jgi:HlyD family secretion protein